MRKNATSIIFNAMFSTIWLILAWSNAITVADNEGISKLLLFLITTFDVLFSRADFIIVSRKARNISRFEITDYTADLFSVLASVGTSTYMIISGTEILAGNDATLMLIVTGFMLVSTYVLASKARDETYTEQ